MTETNPNILIQISKNDLQQLIQEAVKSEISKITDVIKLNPKLSENKSELLSRNETADLLKVSLVTLHKWNLNGTLCSKKLSRRVYYLKEEVFNRLSINSVA